MDKKQAFIIGIGVLALLWLAAQRRNAVAHGAAQQENVGGVTFTTNLLPPLLTPKPDQYNYMFVQEIMQNNGKDVDNDDYWHPWIVGGSVYVPVMGLIPG